MKDMKESTMMMLVMIDWSQHSRKNIGKVVSNINIK